MIGEVQERPLPIPRALPPSNPNPSQVSEGIASLGGRDRTWAFSHGRHSAFMDQRPRHPFPTPSILPPSNPHPSKVGDGLFIQGDLGGRDAAARPGGVAAACAGIPTMSFAELVEHSSRSGSHTLFPSYQCAGPLQAQVLHAKISDPTQQLRTAHV